MNAPLQIHIFAPRLTITNQEFEKNLATGIFRVHQEALTNIMRHSQATEVQTEIQMLNDEILLTIHDNGIGFDQNEARNKNSLGLVGMKERALMFDGNLTIDTESGNGTTVTLKVPVHRNKLM